MANTKSQTSSIVDHIERVLAEGGSFDDAIDSLGFDDTERKEKYDFYRQIYDKRLNQSPEEELADLQKQALQTVRMLMLSGEGESVRLRAAEIAMDLHLENKKLTSSGLTTALENARNARARCNSLVEGKQLQAPTITITSVDDIVSGSN